MTSHYRHRRFSDPAAAFPTLIEPGEIAVNTANRQIAVGDANPGSAGSTLPLLAVRYFDVRSQYAANDYVVQAGGFYRAKVTLTPGAFNSTQWDLFITDAAAKAYADAGDAAITLAYQAADVTLTNAVNTKVAKDGDTMQGYLTLVGIPNQPLHAATKQYVDDQIAAGGLVTLPASSIVYTPTGDIQSTDVQAAIAEVATERAPIYSPAFGGNPTAPLPSANNNSNQIATTAWVNTYTVTYVTSYMNDYVDGQLTAIIGTAMPRAIGIAAVGVSTKYSREDHVHPSDTTRAPLDSPTFIGSPKSVTPPPGDNDTSIATTAFVQNAVGNLPASPFGTGDVKLTIKTTADVGWVMMNDGTMGDASSGGTTRANADTQALFTLLWTVIPNIYCPVSGGRGADATSDFNAHKTIKLPAAVGRALGIAGTGAGLTARALGQTVGAEAVALNSGNMASTTVTLNVGGSSGGSTPGLHFSSQLLTGDGGYTNPAASLSAESGVNPDTSCTLTTSGGATGSPFGIMQPTSFLNAMVKL